MLYQLFEINQFMAAPVRKVMSLQQDMLRSRRNPLVDTRLARSWDAALEIVDNTIRRYDKPAWNIGSTIINGLRVPVEDKVVWAKPFCNLVYFQRGTGNLSSIRKSGHLDPRVLLLAPLSGHYATLLRGTVEALLPDCEVFVSDWVNAADVPTSEGAFDLSDFTDYLMEMMAFVGPKCHVIAVSQPGPAALAAVSMMSEDNDAALPATLTLVGSPIDSRRSPTTANLIAEEKPLSWFRRKFVYRAPPTRRGFMRKVVPGFVQLGGVLAKTSGRHIMAHKEYFKQLVRGDSDKADRHKQFYEEYLSVMDVPAELFMQTAESVFQRHELAKGVYYHRGRLVNPGAITQVALMTVEGEDDDIAGIGQTQAAHELCSGLPDAMKWDYIQPGVGHYGIFTGRRFREEVRPRISDFIRSYTAWGEEKPIQAELHRRIWQSLPNLRPTKARG